MANYTASDITTDEQAALDQIKEETEAAVKYDIAAKNAKDPVTKKAMEHNKKDEIEHAGLMGAVAVKENPKDKSDMMAGVKELDDIKTETAEESFIKKSISQCIKDKQKKHGISTKGSFESTIEQFEKSVFKREPPTDRALAAASKALKEGKDPSFEKYRHTSPLRDRLERERDAGLLDADHRRLSWAPSGLLLRYLFGLDPWTPLPGDEDKSELDPPSWETINANPLGGEDSQDPSQEEATNPVDENAVDWDEADKDLSMNKGFRGLSLDDILLAKLNNVIGSMPKEKYKTGVDEFGDEINGKEWTDEYKDWYYNFLNSIDSAYDMAKLANDPTLAKDRSLAGVSALKPYMGVREGTNELTNEPYEPITLGNIPSPYESMFEKTRWLGSNADAAANRLRAINRLVELVNSGRAGLPDETRTSLLDDITGTSRAQKRHLYRTVEGINADLVSKNPNKMIHDLSPEEMDILLNPTDHNMDSAQLQEFKDKLEERMIQKGYGDSWYWQQAPDGFNIDDLVDSLREVNSYGNIGTVDADVENLKSKLSDYGLSNMSNEAISKVTDLLNSTTAKDEIGNSESDILKGIYDSIVGNMYDQVPEQYRGAARLGVEGMIHSTLSDMINKGRNGKKNIDLGPGAAYSFNSQDITDRNKLLADQILSHVKESMQDGSEFEPIFLPDNIVAALASTKETGNTMTMNNGISIFDQPEVLPIVKFLQNDGVDYGPKKYDELDAMLRRGDRAAMREMKRGNTMMRDGGKRVPVDPAYDDLDEQNAIKTRTFDTIDDLYKTAMNDSEVADALLALMPPVPPKKDGKKAFDKLWEERRALEDVKKGYYTKLPWFLNTPVGREALSKYVGQYPLSTNTGRTLSFNPEVPFNEGDNKMIIDALSKGGKFFNYKGVDPHFLSGMMDASFTPYTPRLKLVDLLANKDNTNVSANNPQSTIGSMLNLLNQYGEADESVRPEASRLFRELSDISSLIPGTDSLPSTAIPFGNMGSIFDRMSSDEKTERQKATQDRISQFEATPGGQALYTRNLFSQYAPEIVETLRGLQDKYPNKITTAAVDEMSMGDIIRLLDSTGEKNLSSKLKAAVKNIPKDIVDSKFSDLTSKIGASPEQLLALYGVEDANKGTGADALHKRLNAARTEADRFLSPYLFKDTSILPESSVEDRLLNGDILSPSDYKSMTMGYDVSPEDADSAYADLTSAVKNVKSILARSNVQSEGEFYKLNQEALQYAEKAGLKDMSRAINNTLSQYEAAKANLMTAARRATRFKPRASANPAETAKEDISDYLEGYSPRKHSVLDEGNMSPVEKKVEAMPERFEMTGKKGDLMSRLMANLPIDVLSSEVPASLSQAYIDSVNGDISDEDRAKKEKTSLFNAILSMNGGVDDRGLPIRRFPRKEEMPELEERVNNIIEAVNNIPAFSEVAPVKPTRPGIADDTTTPEERELLRKAHLKYENEDMPAYSEAAKKYNDKALKYRQGVIDTIMGFVPSGFDDWLTNRGAKDLASAAGIDEATAKRYIDNQLAIGTPKEEVAKLVQGAVNSRSKDVEDFRGMIDSTSRDFIPTSSIVDKVVERFPSLQTKRDTAVPLNRIIANRFSDYHFPTPEERKLMTAEQRAEADEMQRQYREFKDEAFLSDLKKMRYNEDELSEIIPFSSMASLGFADLPPEAIAAESPESAGDDYGSREPLDEKEEEKISVPIKASATECKCTRVRIRSDADDVPDDTGLTMKQLREPTIRDDAEGSSVKHMGDSVIKKSTSELMKERFSSFKRGDTFEESVPQHDVDTKRKKDTPRSAINAYKRKSQAIGEDAVSDENKETQNKRMRGRTPIGAISSEIGAKRTRSNVYDADDETEPDYGTIYWELSDVEPELLQRQAEGGLRAAYNAGAQMDAQQSDIAAGARGNNYLLRKQEPVDPLKRSTSELMKEKFNRRR